MAAIAQCVPPRISFNELELQNWNSHRISYRNVELVKNLLDSAQVEVTFWGAKVVRVQTDTTSLDTLASKLLIEASTRRIDSVDHDVNYPGCEVEGIPISDIERTAWARIESKIQQFYATADVEVQNSNYFTQLLVYLRELIDNIKWYLTPRGFVDYPESWPHISRSLIDQSEISRRINTA
jgi:hypothetical protein